MTLIYFLFFHTPLFYTVGHFYFFSLVLFQHLYLDQNFISWKDYVHITPLVHFRIMLTTLPGFYFLWLGPGSLYSHTFILFFFQDFNFLTALFCTSGWRSELIGRGLLIDRSVSPGDYRVMWIYVDCMLSPDPVSWAHISHE